MNVDSNPIPRWAKLVAVVSIFFAFGALEAMDARTEALIAQADADAARAVAQIDQQHGIECDEYGAIDASPMIPTGSTVAPIRGKAGF